MRATKRGRVERFMLDHGWNRGPTATIRRRLYSVASSRPRWDWGRPLMALTGSDFGGNWDEPRPPTWWYKIGAPKRMAKTGFPRYPLATFEVITDYETLRERTAGLNEDQMYEWQSIGVGQDGELILGHRYWGGSFYGMRKCEVALLRRYLRMWRRMDWFGLRSWLYAQGLHATVHRKKPFACHALPADGHSHWYCHLRRGHDGLHRFNNYMFGEIDGEQIGATYVPEVAS